MTEPHENTSFFRYSVSEEEVCIRTLLQEVYDALSEKGYDPTAQIVGYLMSGDPTFITNHKNARNLLTQIERDTLLEELVRKYLEK